MKRLLLVLLVAAGCRGTDSGPGSPPAGGVPAERIPDQELWNSEITLTSGGRLNARLHAGHIAKFEKERKVSMDTVRVDFYNADGTRASVLTALRGTVDEGSSDLEAFGNVVVKSEQGITLETERLFWRNERGKITTEDPVRLTTAQDTVTGVGVESDPRLENWRIMHDISGTFRRELPAEAR